MFQENFNWFRRSQESTLSWQNSRSTSMTVCLENANYEIFLSTIQVIIFFFFLLIQRVLEAQSCVKWCRENLPMRLESERKNVEEDVFQWGSIIRKQNVRWQHLSRMKSRSFFIMLKKILSCRKCSRLTSGTSSDIYRWWSPVGSIEGFLQYGLSWASTGWVALYAVN